MATSVPSAYRGWVSTAARGTGLPASVVAAQIGLESGFNPRATSPVGAQGIAQFMPGTWRGQGVAGNPYDPNAALQGYTKLMGSLLSQFGGNVRNALAAYNAGPGNLRAGYGYADKILSDAGAGGRGLSLPTSPGSSQTTTTTTTTFDQAAFEQAQRAAIAGQYLASQKNMWQIGPRSTVPTGSVFGPGLLTTKVPNRADYTHTTTAQNTLQTLAGTTALSSHPGLAGGDFATPAPQKVVDMQNFAKTLIGAPYSQANHAASFSQGADLIRKYGTDCSGLVSLLLGHAGVISQPYTTETIASDPGIQPGPGQHVTIYNRSGAGANSHMIVQIGRDWFESGGIVGKGVQQMSGAQAQQELAGGGFRPLHPRGF